MNPYLETLQDTTEQVDSTAELDGQETWRNQPSPTGENESLRRHLITKFSWAIPNTEALTTLAQRSPIVEIGAGNGYWAHCIDQHGGKVTAYDAAPPDNTWARVIEETHHAIHDHHDETLLLCWPSYGADWPGETIRQYDGDTLIYIGEGRGGNTGSSAMHDAISRCFGLAEETIEIPQWRTVSDKLYIFTR